MQQDSIRQKIEALRRKLSTRYCRGGGASPLTGFTDEDVADIFISRAVHPALHADDAVLEWIAARRAESRLTARPVPLDRLERWGIDPATGNISHETGRFFTLTGLKVRHRFEGREIEWDQPIIDQPEIGILGILVKRIDGILHFCLQAKEEPGNVGKVQLSPTVQATYSNYSRVHGGTLPPFVGLFLAPAPGTILFAKLQTEDGGRFLYKSNRNMIVRLDEGAADELPAGFIWLTLRQIRLLLHENNLINACTRSVLSCLAEEVTTNDCDLRPAGEDPDADLVAPEVLAQQQERCARAPHSGEEPESLAQVLQWLDDRKAANHILSKRVGLNTLDEWRRDNDGAISHRDNRFFRIIGIDVTSNGREVPMWSQPILDNLETGIVGLLVREERGRRSFLMQAKAEAGNRTTVQLGPTVQFTPGNYCGNEKLPKPFLFEEFCGRGGFPVLWENWQAEEGARFYQEEHLHRILLLPPDLTLRLPPDFRWLTEEQVRFFLHLGEQVNSCARSILSCLL